MQIVKQNTASKILVRLFAISDGWHGYSGLLSTDIIYSFLLPDGTTRYSAIGSAPSTWTELAANGAEAGTGVYAMGVTAAITAQIGVVTVFVRDQLSRTRTFVDRFEVAAAKTDDINKLLANRTKLDSSANTFTIFDDDGTTPLIVFDTKNASGAPATDKVFERVPQ